MTSEPEQEPADHLFVASEADPALCNNCGRVIEWHPFDKGDDEETADPETVEVEPDTLAVTVAYSAEVSEMRLIQAYGRAMHASGMFPDTKSEAQAVVKIMTGRELGFTTIQSMTGVYIIDGKPVVSANLLAAALRRSEKYDYRIVQHDEIVCVIEVLRRDENAEDGWSRLGEASFTTADADLAGLDKKDNWRKYPKNMVFARAISNAIAFFAPDVFQTRLYTPDELRPDIELDPTGNIIDVESLALPPAPSETASRSDGERTRRTPSRRREKEPLPDVLTSLRHFIRYAFEKAEMQPQQLAEFLGEKTIGGIAAAVQGKFDGDYDAAARAIDNRETPDQGSPEPAPDTEAEAADFVCITCGEVTTDRAYEPVCPDCHERENGSDESA